MTQTGIRGEGHARVRGFTLIELMVVVVVVGILAVVAMPNLISVINANRLRGQTDEMTASIQLARSEATRKNGPVTLCRSTNGSTCAGAAGNWAGWVIVAPANNPALPAQTELVQAKTAQGNVQFSASAHTITFFSTGQANPAATITSCIPTTSLDENQRIISVMVSGGLNVLPHNGSGACP